MLIKNSFFGKYVQTVHQLEIKCMAGGRSK